METFERALHDQGPRVEPATPRAAQAAAGSFFGALSRLRGKRCVHPHGIVFEGSYAPHPSASEVPMLGEGPPRPVVVRLSRSLGVPRPLPDIRGLAVRFVDAHGSGAHQDFLMVTSIDAPLAHHMLVPTRRYTSLSYSSLLPYRIADELRLVGGLPAGERRFELALAALSGRWSAVGTLALEERVPEATAERIRFNPWNTGGAFRPAGPFNGLRAGAYRGSRRGWSA